MKKQLLSVFALLGGLGLATPAMAQTPVFALWPLKVNAQDSTALRSATTTTSTRFGKAFVVADGSQQVNAVTVKPYQSTLGQAFAPLAAGGNWGTSNGGPGGTLKRAYYEQFAVTAGTGATLRADSVLLNAGFLSSSSGTFLGVTYSKSGYATDSADVSGGKGLTGTVTGGFNNPISLAQVTPPAANSTTYRLALNGATGVTMTANQTLTVRVYFSCSSSTNTGRYAVLRSFTIKSTQVVLAAHPVVSTSLGVYPNPATNQLTIPHALASREAQVLVYNATGAKVATQVAQPGTTETNVSLDALANGLYLVEYNDGGQRSTARIIKK